MCIIAEREGTLFLVSKLFQSINEIHSLFIYILDKQIIASTYTLRFNPTRNE